MIIGINGYAGTGKDTVGKIIECLTAGYDFDVILKVLLKEGDYRLLPFSDETSWEIKKWAGKLKVVANMLTGIPIESFEDQDFKKTDMPAEWSVHGMPMTVRDFLQKLGTDGLRDGLHSNTWVNALMSDYKYAPDGVPLAKWIVTDTRFPNEARAIKDKGGIVIRIDRPGYKPINNHPSEVALDNWNFDYKIGNTNGLEGLILSVSDVLKKENLI